MAMHHGPCELLEKRHEFYIYNENTVLIFYYIYLFDLITAWNQILSILGNT